MQMYMLDDLAKIRPKAKAFSVISIWCNRTSCVQQMVFVAQDYGAIEQMHIFNYDVELTTASG